MANFDRAGNIGSQEILMRYKTPLNGNLLSTMDSDILSAGVYEGMVITKTSDSEVSISGGKFIIRSDDYATSKYQIKVKTSNASPISVTLDSTTPYIIATYEWLNAQPTGVNDFYVGFGSTDEDSLFGITPTYLQPLILGKAIYNSAGTVLERIDYSCTMYGADWKIEDVVSNLKVVQSPVADNKVWVKVKNSVTRNDQNYYSTLAGKFSITGGDDELSAIVFPTGGNSRIDLVYINPNDGSRNIATGVPHLTTPVAPSYEGRIPLAEIFLKTGQTQIFQEDIVDVRNFYPMGGLIEVIGSTIKPKTDTATAIQIMKADGTTPIVTVDTLNRILDTNLNRIDIKTSDYSNGSTGSVLQIGLGSATGNTYAFIDNLIAGETGFGHLILKPTGNGNVGIGTSSPTHTLDIRGTIVLDGANRPLLTLQDSASYAQGVGGGVGFWGKYNTAGDYGSFAGITGFKANSIDGDYAGGLSFATRINGGALTERVQIAPNGNVLIGSGIADRPLKVVSSLLTVASFESSNTDATNVSIYNTTTNKMWSIGVTGTNNLVPQFADDGSFVVYCESTTTPALSIQPNGSCLNSGGTWGALSDERLKTNIKEISNPIEKVLNIAKAVKQYEFINQEYHCQGQRTGYIAQTLRDNGFSGHITEHKPTNEKDGVLLGWEYKDKETIDDNGKKVISRVAKKVGEPLLGIDRAFEAYIFPAFAELNEIVKSQGKTIEDLSNRLSALEK